MEVNHIPPSPRQGLQVQTNISYKLVTFLNQVECTKQYLYSRTLVLGNFYIAHPKTVTSKKDGFLLF